MPTHEWDCETWEPGKTGTHDDGTIEDHNHGTLKECLGFAEYDPPNSRIVLVRDDAGGRSWAYLKPDGNLPTHFRDAYGFQTAKVPQRYHDQVERNRHRFPAGLGFCEEPEPMPIQW